MKFRLGFVSNSSSTSFVIHKSALSKKQVEELKKFYNEKSKESDDCDCEMYDDNGLYFNETTNYIAFNDNSGTMDKKLEEMNINEDDIYRENL